MPSGRILTTHTGSLPRPEPLVELLKAKEGRQPYDRDRLEAEIQRAVREVVSRQQQAGVDLVNDGEMSKVGYSTYITDRLTGFEGEAHDGPTQLADVADFPDFARRYMGTRPLASLRRPACSGPVACRDLSEVRRDLANFKRALAEASLAEALADRAFMTAASPGVISVFLPNSYYPTREAYLFALADAMRPEYEAIVEAGLVLQLDCPDLAMSRHGEFAKLDLAQFRRQIEVNVAALNQAVANIPPERMRIHLCWGNYPGPHHYDVALRDIIDVVFTARPAAISYEAANPRHAHEWKIFRDIKLPEDKTLIPGVLDSTTNFIEHPELVAERLCNLARLVGPERVIGGVDCGFSTFAGPTQVSPDIVWRKLASLAEGARLATSML
jgi:5-methyltetrahydropteroyltriglutamate--homocysteine methyltransferase